MTVCANCGHENADDARFCSQCAAALDVPAATREERKVVTVLFADLVGFTARAERLDPEDVRAILAAYHDRVRTELERHGATVEKFIGDAVMALFGAPVAHEDDPERAVRAALAIREALADLNEADPSAELHVRLGINTGEALVSAGPSATAAGDVVNTAARLQAAAPVDGILVGETTFRATERAISYRRRSPVEAKGKSGPVAAWEALEARSRFGVDVRQIGGSPLVGRSRELRALVESFGRVVEERSPQLVTLVGVPGIGKSRLVSELFQRVDALPDLITWRQGRSLPYGDGVAFWALGEMVKAQAGILETDGADAAGEKLREAVAAVAEEDRDRVERFLRLLVGVEGHDEADDRREEAFAAWRLWLETLAEQRPLVLVFEDLHWADDQLLDFVDYLAEWVSGVPLLVVGTARPELLSRRPGWGGGKLNATTLTLAPLSDEETAQLVHVLLGRSVLPVQIQSPLLERAGGIPLYAEEFVRMAGQRGTLEELALPESVQSLIAARIDGLPPEEKALLQDAAVIGKVFWAGTLAALGGGRRLEDEERLHELERKEFIRRERRSSVAGEHAYVFSHTLVPEVAYAQIPRGRRADKHRLAAEWLESLPRPEDHAEMLSHHYVRALEFARAAGSETGAFAERARLALRRAGDRASGLNAFPAAVRFYREALGLWPTDDPERPQLLFRLGSVLYIAEGRGDDELAEAAEGLRAVGDRETAAEAEVALGQLAWDHAERDASDRHLEDAAELLAGAGSSASKARVLAALTRSYMLAGRYREAIEFGGRTLALADSLGLDELRAHALSYIGGAQVRSGDVTGIERGREAIEIARAINSPQLARWLNNYASRLFECGRARDAFPLWDEAEEIAQRVGALGFARFVAGLQTLTLYERGRWDDALERADTFIEAAQKSPHYQESIHRLVRGMIRLARCDADGARADADRGLDVARRVRDLQVLGPLLAFHAALLAELGDLEKASVDADEIVAMRERNLFDLQVVELTVLFETLNRVEDLVRLRAFANASRWRDALDRHLAGDPGGAADVCEEIGVLAAAARWRLLAGALLVARGRQAEADIQLERALAFFRSVGAPRYARQAESLLSATA